MTSQDPELVQRNVPGQIVFGSILAIAGLTSLVGSWLWALTGEEGAWLAMVVAFVLVAVGWLCFLSGLRARSRRER